MACKYRAPWWVSCRWSVEAQTPTGWKQFYCARTRAEAKLRKRDVEHGTLDADGNRSRGFPGRIVPGEGHPSRRA